MPRLTLKILARDYLFNVSEEDTATLQNAANIINSRAARLHAADTTMTAERLAVTAALEIAFDSLNGKLAKNPEEAICADRMSDLNRRCSEALTPNDPAQ